MECRSIRINAPGEVEIIRTEIPAPGKDEALLKVLYGGICGSDLGSYRGTFAYFDYPRIPGHEFSAEIVEIDEEKTIRRRLANMYRMKNMLKRKY